MTKFDILSVGSVYLDIISPNFPFKNSFSVESEIVGGSYILTSGGSAMNFSRVSAFLGLKPVLIGKIGSDNIGEILSNLIKQTGIIPALIKSGAAQTNVGINFINNAGQTITTSVGTANQDLNAGEITTQLKTYLPEVKYLYLSGFFKLKQLIPHYPQIFSLAKQSGVKIIIDPGRTGNIATGDERNALLNLMKDIDVYLPNLDEILDLWQAQDLGYAIKKVRSTTNALIVVKQAEKGATGQLGQDLVQVPSYPVATISTVGAGDSFNAGFIKAQSLNKPLQSSLEYANATAALAISQKTLPTFEQVENFILAHKSQTQTPLSTSSTPTIDQPPDVTGVGE